jgi:trehalose-6-phosphate synthase
MDLSSIPCRDGLNCLPIEYTLTRSIATKTPSAITPAHGSIRPRSTHRMREGVVVMSEFVSSARVMRGAIVINPWKIDEVKSV